MSTMILTKEESIKVSGKDAQRLKSARMACAAVWNDCVALAKAYRLANDGQWISKSELEKATKGGKYQLHSQSIQAVVTDYTESRDSTKTKRKQGDKKANYPWKQKKYRTIEFKQMAIKRSPQNTIQVSLSARNTFDTGLPWMNGIGVVRLTWNRNHYAVQYTVTVAVPEPVAPELEKLGGGDIGEIHPLALSNAAGKTVIISSRALRSAKQFRNKALADLYRKRSKCKRRSRQWKKLGKQISRVCQKAENTCKDALHKATRKAVNAAAGALDITTMVIGDPKGVADKTKVKERLNRKARQKIGQMETGTIKKLMEYKNTMAGIKTVFTEERGTTSDCPKCATKNLCKGRVYKCKGCGFVAHRDGKASFMMMRKVRPGMPLPAKFAVSFQRALPKYRTGERKTGRHQCVEGPDGTRVSSAAASLVATEHHAEGVTPGVPLAAFRPRILAL